jgi:transposase-like protein
MKMHKSRRAKLQQIRGQQRRGDVGVGKTAVTGILDRETRRVRAKVVPNVRRDTLQAAILNYIAPGSKLYTDDASTYRWAAGESDFIHEVVSHAREYVRGQVHTQGIENFWSLLKRTLRGTYVAVEPFHLDRYLDEQVFRFNNRATKDNPLNDEDRFAYLMSQVAGKRLTYAALTGKDADSLHHSAAGTGEEEPF